MLRGPDLSCGPTDKAPLATLADLPGVLDDVRGAGLAIEFEVTGAVYPVAAGVDLTAYRIIQEALTNTLRHTEAIAARVTLGYEPGYVTVRVSDAGPGPGLAGPGRAGERAPGGLAAPRRLLPWPVAASGWPASPSGSPPAAAT